jgi:hypothetical protein
MKASLRALLHGALDYAGLFPPASLPTDAAVRDFARYRQEPEGWMLGRFVCQAARLVELDAQRAGMAAGPPWPFTIIGRHGDTAGALGASLLPQHRLLVEFLHDYEGRATIDGFEARLPVAVDPSAMFMSDDPERVSPRAITGNIVTLFQHRFRFGPFAALPVFAEAPESEAWRELTAAVVGVFGAPENRGYGFKLRCGGATAVPSSEQVAFTIAACRDAGVPLKFTAGLHQPLRHDAAHGFMNVFVAAALAQARGLNEEQIRIVVEDGDAASFAFDDAGLRWRDLSATTEEVAAARRLVVGFGSCSFDEPREGLRALGWLS